MTPSNATLLLKDATATGAGPIVEAHAAQFSWDCKVEGSGPVTATILIEASNFKDDPLSWMPWATVTLSGTDYDIDKIALWAPWKYLRGNLTAISGTDAKVNVSMGAARP
jgi:hypothetical protein